MSELEELAKLFQKEAPSQPEQPDEPDRIDIIITTDKAATYRRIRVPVNEAKPNPLPLLVFVLNAVNGYLQASNG